MASVQYSYLDGNADDEDGQSAISALDDVPDGGAAAWLQVAGSFCITLSTWGVINMYGVFQTYYESHTLKDYSQSNIAWIGSLQSGFLLIVCLFVGPVYDAGYTELLTCTGTALIVFGMMMASICTGYWQLLLAQGLAVGVGAGCLYLPGASIISQYFKEKRGIAFGISALGSSVGGIIFPIVFRQLQPRVGLAWAIRAMALIQLATLMVPVIWMKPRTRSKMFIRLVDWEILKDWPFTLLMIGMFFGYMGIYVTFCYIEIYALTVCDMSASLAPYILTITNSGAFFGRLLPNYLSDHYIGPMNAHISFAAAATVIAYSWIAVKDTPGVLAFSVLDGFFSGTFVTLGGPIVFALTTDPDTVGTRMGMLTGVCGVALLIGNPLAGAILDHGSWVGLQVWAASLLLAAALFIAWARIARYGADLRVKV